jgi:RNA-directed DNA polymerase
VLQKIKANKMVETNTSVETPSVDLVERKPWAGIEWRPIERYVYRQQVRIYRAARRGDLQVVHSIQRALMRSEAARLLAVRRVTQDNRGKRTAGIDGVKSVNPAERWRMVDALRHPEEIKPLPVRRVLIPKPGKKEKRPLGIPAMLDRAHQALVKLALEPQWEARFEGNSYGFRPGRSAQDAIEAIFNQIRYQPKFVLDADIKGCFDNIDHRALLEKLDAPPAIREAVHAWLKAGVMVQCQFEPTESGTPQGGVISPLLANVALHGLEEVARKSYRVWGTSQTGKKWSNPVFPTLIRYADDFVVLCADLKGVQAAQAAVQEFLADMGLILSPSKTRVTHTLEKYEENVGLTFLGFDIRQFKAGKYRSGTLPNTGGMKLGFKTFITPSKEGVKRHLKQTGKIIDLHIGKRQADLIRELSRVLAGWANYYRFVRCHQTFRYCDHVVWKQLWDWAKRTACKKHNGRDLAERFWAMRPPVMWKFQTPDGRLRLTDHRDVCCTELYHKVKGDASPLDGNLLYWAQRLERHPLVGGISARLLRKQGGRCPWCGLLFREGELWERDHIDRSSRGQKDWSRRFQLLHAHCHDQKTTAYKDYVPRGRAVSRVKRLRH